MSWIEKMSSYLFNYETDASKCNVSERCEDVSNLENIDNSHLQLLQQLSHPDLKSVLFLLLNHMDCPYETYMDYMTHSKNRLLNEIAQICSRENIKNRKEFTVELLGTIQHFALTRKLGWCKHKFQEQMSRFQEINPLWKLLYSICKEIDGEELKKLSNLLYSDENHASCCEELICMLLRDRRIDTRDFSEFAEALSKIERHELRDNLVEFRSQYHIPTPTLLHPCGLAVIVNIEKFQDNTLDERVGNSIDRDNLYRLWSSFGLRVECYDDMPANEIEALFRRMSSDFNPDYWIFVACLLSHGKKDCIYASDGQPVNINFLIDTMANKCERLVGKPKLFLIQACRENREQGPSYLPQSNEIKFIEGNETDSIAGPGSHINEDVYVVHSTLPGRASYRSRSCGSVFITNFVDEFERYGHKEDIEQITKQVRDKMTDMMPQISPATGTLRKQLILKKLVPTEPGL